MEYSYQVGLQLIVENQAGIPLVMQALSGNSSDKKSFSEAINTHVRQLQVDLGIEYLIGDSALYTAESLQKMKDLLWISRVPETLKDAQYLIEQIAPDLMINLDKEACQSICITYADIPQRWTVNYSPQAYQRALKTVNKHCLKASGQELKQFNNVCQKELNEVSASLKPLSFLPQHFI